MPHLANFRPRTLPVRALPFRSLPLRGLALVLFSAGLGPAPLPTAAAADDEIITVIYDVTDLVHRRPDFPAPRLGLGGVEDPEPVDADDAAGWTMDDLVEIIERLVLSGGDATADARVSTLGTSLVIAMPREDHARVDTALRNLRTGSRTIYTVEARWLDLPTTTLETLGIKPTARGARAHRVEGETVAALLASVAENDSARVLHAPRLSVFARQRAHVLVVDQSAYVDHFERDPVTGADHPVVETMQTGITLEVRVRPRRKAAGIVLDWEVQVATPVPGSGAGSSGGNVSPEDTGEVELAVPEIETTIREGRMALGEGQAVVIPGLPHPDGKSNASGEGTGRTVLVLTVTAVDLGAQEPSED